MLFFPNCKINLGLYVTEKRKDGFHNIETVFYPVRWTDAIEVLVSNKNNAEKFSLHWEIGKTDIPLENQLIYKAWKMVDELHDLPPVEVHFLKNIPMGAGLGGGSSDAAHMIRLLDEKFALNLGLEKMLALAEQLGSDCPFFILNTAQFAEGKGEKMRNCSLDLSDYYLLLVYPGIHCDTKLAYQNIRPQKGRKPLPEILQTMDFAHWKKELINDFESGVFEQHPAIAQLKWQLYNLGANYASLSGSGSTVFGIFSEKPALNHFQEYRYYLQEPAKKAF